MSQELTDAELAKWLREYLDWMVKFSGRAGAAFELSPDEVAKFNAIASRLERPKVEGWSHRHNGELFGFSVHREFIVGMRNWVGEGEVVATMLAVRHRTPEEDLLDRIGSRTGDHPLPECSSL